MSHSFIVSDKIEAKLYHDSRPNKMEIADLQKGLVLELDSEEIIGEGIGFGAPVVIYEDDVFFSKTARLEKTRLDSVTKIFEMDAISRIEFGERIFGGSIYKRYYDIFSRIYIRIGWIQPFFRILMGLKRRIGFKTRFVRVKDRGSVRVRFKFTSPKMLINVDLTRLKTNGCREILLLNEQGAESFTKYKDSNGKVLDVTRIGAWERVESKSATLMGSGVRFTMDQKSNAKLLRGSEEVPGKLSWVGFAYSLRPSTQNFDYFIQIGGN